MIVGCLDDDALGAYIDGALSIEEIARIDTHINGCAPCRQNLSALAAVQSVATPSREEVGLGDTIAATPSFEAFRRRLAAGGVDQTRLVVKPGGAVTTIAVGSGRASPSELPLLVGGDRRELALQGQIGRGGMALVLAARQIPLGREVAVKRAVPGSQDPHEASANLIREARVTGSLEHPNIVPIHALGLDERGEVLLVMKRIEGTSWAERLRARKDPADDLDRHLEILMEVCITAHFAHSRGVIHRDLKPGNVMVGSFGEVYVLDWGLALSLEQSSMHEGVAGTPQYMAPEMAVPDGRVDERSDVYLLGAILHHILTGRPPHEGADTIEVLYHAYVSAPPSLPDDVPTELAAICGQALARDPAARFASAAELRTAIADFRRHASARALCAQARVHLRELERIVATRSTDDLGAHDAFSAARFGFAAATGEWSQSDDARAGIADTLHAMARYEIDRRHLDAAEVLANQLPATPPALAEQLARLRDELSHEAELRARGAQAIHDADLTPNRRRRVVLLLAASVAWAAYGVTCGIRLRAGIHPPGHLEMTAAHGGVALLVIGLWPWFARQGRANRTFFETALAMLVGDTVAWLIAWSMNAPMAAGIAIAQLLAAAVIWAGLTFFDRRALAGPLIMFLGTPAVLLLDRWAFDINGVVVGASLGYIASRWRW